MFSGALAPNAILPRTKLSVAIVSPAKTAELIQMLKLLIRYNKTAFPVDYKGENWQQLEFGRFGSNCQCPMFRYSGEKIPMSDSDVYLFGHAKLCRRGGRRSAAANDR